MTVPIADSGSLNDVEKSSSPDPEAPNAHPGPLAAASTDPAPVLSTNNLPIHLLSPNFTGRENDIALITQLLEAVHSDVPTRCAIHGRRGVGKSQVSIKVARDLHDKGRYQHVFWIQASTIEKLYQGFSRLLQAVAHPDRSLHQHSTAVVRFARRWLESDSDSAGVTWLLVLDNVTSETVNLLKEHLPCANSRGNILFTTRTEAVAKALTDVAGEQHGILELRVPDVEEAVNLLLQHLPPATDTKPDTNHAREVVKRVGCLPLAVEQIAAYMITKRTKLYGVLTLLNKASKTDVCIDVAPSVSSQPLITFFFR